jgi:hypothetical protein
LSSFNGFHNDATSSRMHITLSRQKREAVTLLGVHDLACLGFAEWNNPLRMHTQLLGHPGPQRHDRHPSPCASARSSEPRAPSTPAGTSSGCWHGSDPFSRFRASTGPDAYGFATSPIHTRRAIRPMTSGASPTPVQSSWERLSSSCLETVGEGADAWACAVRGYAPRRRAQARSCRLSGEDGAA